MVPQVLLIDLVLPLKICFWKKKLSSVLSLTSSGTSVTLLPYWITQGLWLHFFPTHIPDKSKNLCCKLHHQATLI